MIRLCTHCKKADTEYEQYKYCQPCYLKCLDWLDQKAQERPEPESLVPQKDTGRVRKNYEGDE